MACSSRARLKASSSSTAAIFSAWSLRSRKERAITDQTLSPGDQPIFHIRCTGLPFLSRQRASVENQPSLAGGLDEVAHPQAVVRMDEIQEGQADQLLGLEAPDLLAAAAHLQEMAVLADGEEDPLVLGQHLPEQGLGPEGGGVAIFRQAIAQGHSAPPVLAKDSPNATYSQSQPIFTRSARMAHGVSASCPTPCLMGDGCGHVSLGMESPTKRFFSYNEIHRTVAALAAEIQASGFDPDVTVAIGTGGVHPRADPQDLPEEADPHRRREALQRPRPTRWATDPRRCSGSTRWSAS